MKFFKDNVSIVASSPPKEIIECMTGGCGLWQIIVLFICCVAEFMDSMRGHSMTLLFPPDLNYTCLDGNGSQCFTVNGTKCANFVFIKTYKHLTFTEKLLLVCDQEAIAFWLYNTHMIGLIIGYFIVGLCADTFGLRITMMTFIPLQTVTALFIISSNTVGPLFITMLTNAIFSTSLSVMTVLGASDIVGNTWRTLSLGLVCLARITSTVVFPYYSYLFVTIEGMIAASTVLPLTLLIPLLYYKDNPNHVFILSHFARGEEILRRIAKFNRRPISVNVKIRPVQITYESRLRKGLVCFRLFKYKRTRRAYLCLICIWFFVGYCSNTLIHYNYSDLTNFSFFGVSAFIGSVIVIILCHFIQHKVVIGLFTIMKSIMISVVFVNDVVWNQKETFTFMVLKWIAAAFTFATLTALINITPRMFPTEARATGLGFCAAVATMGYFSEEMVCYYLNRSYGAVLILLLSPVFELYASFGLWKVHKRELPDFVIDCAKFQHCYKPTRYYTICEDDSIQEIEVKSVDLNVENYHHFRRHHWH